MNFSSKLTINSLVVIESLEENEFHTGRYLVEDLSGLAVANNLPLVFGPTSSKEEFFANFAKLTADAALGMRPILHLELHGTATTGLEISPSKETVSWDELGNLCRSLNRATNNNLVVVLAACSGYQAITAVKITDLTPFFALIGPTQSVSNQEIRNLFGAFYRDLIDNHDVGLAVSRLNPHWRLYHCERLFASGFARYLREHSIGAGRKNRIEQLLTKSRALSPNIDLKAARRHLKRITRPNAADFDRFRRTFLLNEDDENSSRFPLQYSDILKVLGLSEARGAH